MFGNAQVALAAAPAGTRYNRVVVLVELKGGNDGLNTLIPYTDPAYYSLRPRIAIKRDDVVQLSDRAGLHPSLAPLAPAMARVRTRGTARRGVPRTQPVALSLHRDLGHGIEKRGVPAGRLAHARLCRATGAARFRRGRRHHRFRRLGPLAGGGTRAIALANTEQFLRRAKLAQPTSIAGNPALAHVLKVESDIVQAAAHLDARHKFRTEFPIGKFRQRDSYCSPGPRQSVRGRRGAGDTDGFRHALESGRYAGAAAEDLAGGLVALKDALVELDKWNDAVVLTYAEFGRRPKENISGGTDHGTANVQFALGGRVTGGLYGAQPDLSRLSGDGNLPYALDFRAVYAALLDSWWGVDSRAVLGGRFAAVPFLKA